jgi:hypothetical protein
VKKNILNLAALIILFSSCQKDKCKQQQVKDLEKELELFQKAVSNPNLTTLQINELTKRHEEKNKQIMAECN